MDRDLALLIAMYDEGSHFPYLLVQLFSSKIVTFISGVVLAAYQEVMWLVKVVVCVSKFPFSVDYSI